MSYKRGPPNNYEASSKRPRYENGHGKQQRTSTQTAPQQVPDLPTITSKYEAIVYTHPSIIGHDPSSSPMKSYDRLEFLGDAYLEIIASRFIWESYRDIGAGRMSQIRELLVKNETLSEFAIAYGMNRKLKVAASSRPQDATSQIKMNGDVFEAYVAAVILSDPVKGFENAEDWLTALWKPRLKDVKGTPADLKSKQELAKRILVSGIKISYVDERPPQKGKGIETYFIGVYLTGWGYDNQHLGSGTGLSKTAAGMEAAAKALENTTIIDDIAVKKADFMAKKKAEEANTSQALVQQG